VTGDSEASGNVLQDIESHLVETGEQEELAQNLLRQGRLYIDSSRYDSAIEVLSRGVGLEQSSLTLLQGELALGTALNQAGRSSEALVHLDRAARISPGGDFRQPSSVLDLASALDQISDIHRQQANFQQMNEARLAQRRYLRDAAQQAEWAYERGIDASMQSGFDSLGAFDQFRAAHRLAESSGENLWLELSRLRLCAINQIRGRGDPLCQSGNVRKAYDTLVQTGTGRQAAEAALAYTRLLELNGQATNAFEVANNQVGGLLENGHASLGAWYWQWREALFSQYLSLAIGIEGQAGSNDASRSLLALARARAVERSANATAKAPEVSGLSQFLRDLPADAAVLSYYIFEDSAYAWLGRGSGVQRIQLSGASQIRSQCAELRDIIQSGGWTGFDRLAGALGKSLLEPVEDDLPSMVYFVGQGDLLGIPVDSLLLDGEPLATRRQVINLDRFPGSPETFGRTKILTLSTVFLAGDPVDWSGEFASRLESSGEMKIVTERFVGPGLRSIQGVSLLLDEFTDSHYGEADLVHLAVPGIVDLSTAHGSGLFLSEPARGAGRQRLEAEALELMPLNADLVFFSRSEFSGTATAVESDLGFISSALAAGAGAVIASLWPVEAETRERFVAGFYDRLLDDRDAATALALTKSDTLSSLGGHDWASFQLFLN
jgi:tetratricopeptide (TPR) repeat protein